MKNLRNWLIQGLKKLINGKLNIKEWKIKLLNLV